MGPVGDFLETHVQSIWTNLLNPLCVAWSALVWSISLACVHTSVILLWGNFFFSHAQLTQKRPPGTCFALLLVTQGFNQARFALAVPNHHNVDWLHCRRAQNFEDDKKNLEWKATVSLKWKVTPHDSASKHEITLRWKYDVVQLTSTSPLKLKHVLQICHLSKLKWMGSFTVGLNPQP